MNKLNMDKFDWILVITVVVFALRAIVLAFVNFCLFEKFAMVWLIIMAFLFIVASMVAGFLLAKSEGILGSFGMLRSLNKKQKQ